MILKNDPEFSFVNTEFKNTFLINESDNDPKNVFENIYLEENLITESPLKKSSLIIIK